MVKIPRRLDDLLPAIPMEKLLDALQQPDISGKVREPLHRVGWHDAAPLESVRDAWHQARSWLETMVAGELPTTAAPRGINASGQLLSPSAAGVPWGTGLALHYARMASEYQYQPQVMQYAQERLQPLCEDHAWVCLGSVAEAVRLLAATSAAAQGVVVARTDAVRIAGLGDVRSMVAAGGNGLIEIGAANTVLADEWSSALAGGGRMVLLTSPNNLSAADSRQMRSEAVAAAQTAGARVVELLADGTFNPSLADRYHFPTPSAALASGADVVILPLQLLLAGPPGALVIGCSELIDPLRLAAANLGGLLQGAGLATAVAAIQSSRQDEFDAPSIASQLLANPENLRNRARRLALQLTDIGAVGSASECEMTTPLGPSPWNRYQLSSWGVRLVPRKSLAELHKHIASGEAKHALKLQLAGDTQCVDINLRFVPPQRDHELVLVIGEEGLSEPAVPVAPPPASAS